MTYKQLDLFELFWCGPEVHVDKTEPLKQIFSLMSIIQGSSLSLSLLVSEISPVHVQNLF